ncbi:MAG: GTP-binding protein [Gordonia sp. (in: high G+C Gram-positive bacteria)]
MNVESDSGRSVTRHVEARTPVTLVTGLDADAVARTADALLVAGTTLIHHDLSEVGSGQVIRTIRAIDLDGREVSRTTEVSLEHGCVSCTLRLDLLPLLRRMHRRSGVERIVLQLHALIEPEALCWAVEHVVVAGMPGFLDAPAARDVTVAATIACVPEMDWLDAATGDMTIAEAELGDADDDRTLAQLAVGQVAFADALVIAAADPGCRDAWASARLIEVLRRLAPGAPMVLELPQRPIRPSVVRALLGAIPAGARRGAIDGPHDPLLRRAPTLTAECGVSIAVIEHDRPFHPARLHDALDHLLDGVVCTRGRLWLATRPDEVFWLESAGGALRIGACGPWLAAMDADQRAGLDPERLAMSALRWRPQFGDRHSALMVLVHRADPAEIAAELAAATLTDAEMADGPDLWMAYDDPFGTFHTDPCAESVGRAAGLLPIAERIDNASDAMDHIELADGRDARGYADNEGKEHS